MMDESPRSVSVARDFGVEMNGKKICISKSPPGVWSKSSSFVCESDKNRCIEQIQGHSITTAMITQRLPFVLLIIKVWSCTEEWAYRDGQVSLEKFQRDCQFSGSMASCHRQNQSPQAIPSCLLFFFCIMTNSYLTSRPLNQLVNCLSSCAARNRTKMLAWARGNVIFMQPFASYGKSMLSLKRIRPCFNQHRSRIIIDRKSAGKPY